ncbi:ab42ac18-310a-4958-860a-d7a58aa2fad9 [Thermothielavioides terrestris]|uniref:Ab42ac18-310a-4958-860a-d7a58aa2fad9 n=1 Tax=Thermothielavioides terrestris TaxID=2587410 RepID=A0A446BKW3_9PEZI|nr:ab42ac18-310a-4958-860a-d7a58aa2fad9 [Thermothielavioides terrestris]
MEPDENSPLLPARDQHDDDSEDTAVSWDGADDPQNPANWGSVKIWAHILVVSLLTFLIPLGATMMAPAIDQVMHDFGSASPVLSSLVVSIYVLGWGVGPVLLGPLSEVYGRLPVYTCSNIGYVLATAGCGLSTAIGPFLVLRFLAGALGSTPMTIGGGTISDVVPVHSRGVALSLYMFGPVLGPCVGPLAGGYLTDALGWRSVLWILGGVYACMTVVQVLVMRETYPAAILARRRKLAQRKTGSASTPSSRGLTPQSKVNKSSSSWSASHAILGAVLRPAKLTVQSPVSTLSSLISAYVNGLVFLILTTAPFVLQTEYGFTPHDVGVAFFGYGLGNIAGLVSFTLTSDRMTAGPESRPERRLIPAIVAAPLMALGMVWFGWASEAHAHWAVPVAGSAVVGAGNVLFFSACVGYLIDAFTVHAASAIAANMVIRSIGGALLPLAGRSLYEALRWTRASCLLAFPLLLATVVLVYMYAHGHKMRQRYPVRL